MNIVEWGSLIIVWLQWRKSQKKRKRKRELLLQTVWPNVFFLYGMLGIAIWCSIWLNIASTSNHIQYSLWNYGFLTIFLSFFRPRHTYQRKMTLRSLLCLRRDQYVWSILMSWLHNAVCASHRLFCFLTFVNILLFFFMARKESQ